MNFSRTENLILHNKHTTHNKTREDAPTRRALSFCTYSPKGKRKQQHTQRANKDKARGQRKTTRAKKDNEHKRRQTQEQKKKNGQKEGKHATGHITA